MLGCRHVYPVTGSIQERDGPVFEVSWSPACFFLHPSLRGEENSVVDNKTAHELYFPPFVAAIEAGVGGAMCSYNKVDGQYSCSNSYILNDVLKPGLAESEILPFLFSSFKIWNLPGRSLLAMFIAWVVGFVLERPIINLLTIRNSMVPY